jgi:RNA polymerase sigma factor (sigma-70 family)
MNMPSDVLDTVSDDALLVAFGNGDNDAARALSIRLMPKVLGLAIRMLNDQAEAEDAAQDAMMRLWRVAPDWRQGEAKVSTWLYRVVSNLCIDRLRKRKTVDIDAIEEPADPKPSVEANMIAAERQKVIAHALQGLPDRQRQAVVLRHIEGASNPEIAEIMDISIEAVESLTARGKRALANVLSKRKEELGFSNG